MTVLMLKGSENGTKKRALFKGLEQIDLRRYVTQHSYSV